MTTQFKEIIKAGLWFTAGFLAHFALLYLHHHS